MLLPVNSFGGWKRLTFFSGVDTGKLFISTISDLSLMPMQTSLLKPSGVCAPLPERRGFIGKKEVYSGRGREMREGKGGENY